MKKNKKILVAISGSISAYKMIDVVKDLKEKGHSISVMLSKGALNFLNPQIFKYFDIPVYSIEDDFKQKKVLHIDLVQDLDLFICAPATANIIGKFSNGIADCFLSTVFMALPKNVSKVVFPAMNTKMYENKILQDNIKKLNKLLDVNFIGPEEGLLACGDLGLGKLVESKEMMELIPLLDYKKENKLVVITAGATIAPIDSVRYISNPAKGISAYLLAKEYLSLGYKVKVIRGKYSSKKFKYLLRHPQYQEKVIVTTQDLLDEVKKIKKAYLYISPMAVSDIKVEANDKKIKKKYLQPIDIKEAPDVLKYVLDSSIFDKVIGFAAESSLDKNILSEKIRRKPVDLLVANLVDSGLQKKNPLGFGSRNGIYKIIDKDKNILLDQELNKNSMVKFIVEYSLK